MTKEYFVYILTNKSHTVLYTGVTSNIWKRVDQHLNITFLGFTSKYNVNILVYAESFNYMNDAICREKQLKAGSRIKKIKLIEKTNPQWRDLSK